MPDTKKQNNTLKIIDKLPEKSSPPIKLTHEKDSKISLVPQQSSETISRKKIEKLKREHAPDVSEILNQPVESNINPEESWGESHIKIPSGWIVLAIILLTSSIFFGISFPYHVFFHFSCYTHSVYSLRSFFFQPSVYSLHSFVLAGGPGIFDCCPFFFLFCF